MGQGATYLSSMLRQFESEKDTINNYARMRGRNWHSFRQSRIDKVTLIEHGFESRLKNYGFINHEKLLPFVSWYNYINIRVNFKARSVTQNKE